MNIRDEITRMIEAARPIPTPVDAHCSLHTDLGFDSLAFVRFLVDIENAYSIMFALDEMASCLRVENLITLVEYKLKECGGHA